MCNLRIDGFVKTTKLSNILWEIMNIINEQVSEENSSFSNRDQLKTLIYQRKTVGSSKLFHQFMGHLELENSLIWHLSISLY